MRSPNVSLVAAALALPLTLSLTACGPSRPRRTWSQPTYAQAQPTPPSYAMPWAVPVPAAPAAMPPAAPATGPAWPSWSAQRDKCLADAGTRDDCQAALRGAADAWDPAPGAARQGGDVHAVYRKACEKKAKLQGCGVFKSSAVTEADRPTVELLMVCEAGRGEACEDVKTKAAPLVAWHGTLKAEHCKKGHSALCKSHKECKGGTQWTCRAATQPAGAGDVCGCAPRTCEGTMTIARSMRAWPDGSPRGVFTCSSAAK